MRDRSYQWLKDVTSFGLISDKSEKLPILHTKSAIFGLRGVMSHACAKACFWPGMNVPIFQIFGLKLLSACSRLDNK